MTATTYLFNNNASSSLALGVSASATTLQLQPGGGANFPSLSVDEVFILTLTDAATGRLTEIMLCTARSTDYLTVTRGQEGTTARAWLAGDLVNQFITAGTVTNFLQLSAAAQIASTQLANSGVTAGTYGSTTEIPIVAVSNVGLITTASTASLVSPSYQGTWNANTNTPTLTSGMGTAGYYYLVNVAGTTDLDGNNNWNIGDQALFNGTVWTRIPGVNDGVFTTLEISGLTGYMDANASSAVTAATTIPVADLSGAIAVSKGGTGTDTLTGIIYSEGTNPFIPATGQNVSDVIGSNTVEYANSLSNLNSFAISPNSTNLNFNYIDDLICNLDSSGNFTPDGVCTGGFGFEQHYVQYPQTGTPSRVLNALYHNTTTKPIFVAVIVNLSINLITNSIYATLAVYNPSGQPIYYLQFDESPPYAINYMTTTFNGIVLPGQSYVLTDDGSSNVSIITWSEYSLPS